MVNVRLLRTQSKMSVCLYYLISALNRPDAKDTDIEMLRDVIVDSLFCVLVSLGLFLSFKNNLNNVLCFYCLMMLLIRVSTNRAMLCFCRDSANYKMP